ncbi:hypothetical protein BD769DRAFT_1667189 [Suillus cothurnatus]|nr:hypothetical protein BD769DRAFT_1667189 [Suillus cothurnatus]
MTSYIYNLGLVQRSTFNLLPANHRKIKFQRIVIMVKYCGYLVANEWLYQRGVEMGHPRPTTYDDSLDTIILASGDLRAKTGVYTYTKLRRVKTLQGKRYWCIAFAASDPWQGLPTSAPPEERYKPLKEALQRKGPPLWFQAP